MRLLNKKITFLICSSLLVALTFILSPVHANAACSSSLPTDKGTASTTFTVTASGTYRLWAHVYAPTSGSNVFELSIDNGCPIANVGGSAMTAGAFSWAGYSAGTTSSINVNLNSGSHTITVAGQDASVGVDRILLETNGSCIPSGSGSNCVSGSTSQSSLGGTTNPSPPTTGQSLSSNGQSVSTGNGDNVKHTQQKTSITRVILYAAVAAVFAAGLCLGLIYYSTKPNNFLKKLPLINHKKHLTPGLAGAGANIVVMSGSEEPLDFLHNKRSAILITVIFSFGVGLITAISLAAQDNTIIIDLTNAKVSGQAQLVSSSTSLTGHMIQFGSGNPNSKAVASTGSSQPSKSGSGSSSGGSSSSSSPAPPVNSSNCSNPSWNSSDPEDTDPIGSDDVWWVNNDAWSGSHGPQSIFVCNQSSWYAVSNQPNVGGQVETYPDSEYDISGRGNATKTIAQYNSITSSFSENYPAAGSWDAAYDLWLNNWSTEIMIWNQWTGTQTYWPSDKSVTVSLGGVNYWFQNLGGEYIFFRQNQVTSGSVDILSAFRYLVSQGLVKSTDVPTQLEYGVEICSTSGTETFPMTGLNFTLN